MIHLLRAARWVWMVAIAGSLALPAATYFQQTRRPEPALGWSQRELAGLNERFPLSVPARASVALGVPQSYYEGLAAAYTKRRDMLLEILERQHFTCYKPYGAYYIMTDIAAFGFRDDVEFALKTDLA